MTTPPKELWMTARDVVKFLGSPQLNELLQLLTRPDFPRPIPQPEGPRWKMSELRLFVAQWPKTEEGWLELEEMVKVMEEVDAQPLELVQAFTHPALYVDAPWRFRMTQRPQFDVDIIERLTDSKLRGAPKLRDALLTWKETLGKELSFNDFTMNRRLLESPEE